MKQLLLFIFTGMIYISKSQLSPVYDSIPMRDGKKLAMTLFNPSGCSSCPTILIQTPYNRLYFETIGLPLNVGFNINAFNYNIVIVDWRGFYGSAAALGTGLPDRGEDGYDAVQWISAQSWSNGKVGTWGPSALGKCQFQTAKKNPPNLVCAVPLVAGPQTEYQEYYPGGVYRTEYVEQLDALGYGLSPVVLSYPVYNFVWTSTENSNFYPDSIRVPTFMIGGWYDHNTELMVNFFNAIRSTTTGVQNDHRFLVGPWVHGGSGIAFVGSSIQGELSYPNAADWNDSLALMFFDYHMRGIANGWNTTPYVQYYQMGENVWQNSSTWPPAGLSNINLFMHDNGLLNEVSPSAVSGSLNINYNPLDPSPTIGGSTLRSDLDQGPYDQLPLVESRGDILSFTSVELGSPVILKGNVQAHLKVSSNKKDTDFAVRLTDVYPDGRSMLLVDGIRRMRFRDGFLASDTSIMSAGAIYDCIIDLPTTSITFLTGHKIRVDITSSIYPKYNRNDNSGGMMYPSLNGDSLVNPSSALNTIYLNSVNSSYISLPLVSFPNSLKEITNEIELNVFPNPANNLLNIKLNSKNQNLFFIRLTDKTGRVVFNEKIAVSNGLNNYSINTSKFENGVYGLNIGNENETNNASVVIQH